MSTARPTCIAEFRGVIKISSGIIPAPVVVTRAVMECVNSMLPHLEIHQPAEVLALYLLAAVASSSVSPPKAIYGSNAIISVLEATPRRCAFATPSGPESADISFDLDTPKRFLFFFTSTGERTDYSGEGVFSVSVFLERGRHLLRACHVSPEWVPPTINWPQYSGTMVKLAQAVFQ